MILLDTHTLIWLDEGSDRLGTKSREAIDTALENNELFVATISFWEAAMLIEKGRLTMQTGLDEWRRSLINYGLQELPLTGEIAISSARLPNFQGDPADRIIVATARRPMSSCTQRTTKYWAGSMTCSALTLASESTFSHADICQNLE